MRASILSAAAATAFLAIPATASVVTLGSRHAESCFEAADAGARDASAMRSCDIALNEEALEIRDRAGTFVNRGILHMKVNNVAAATRDFDSAIKLNAQEPEAWLNKSIALVTHGDSAAAIPLADRALQLHTRRPALAHFVRGIAYEDIGNVGAAYSDLVRARDIDPKWSMPAKELARYSVQRR